jgi:hypothetical protein
MRPLFVVGPVLSWSKRYVQNYVLHFVPVDGVEHFSGIFGWERYVLCFYVSRKQACGQGLNAVLLSLGLGG